MNDIKVYSVSEFNAAARTSLSSTFGTIVVQGEVTGYRERAAGNKLVFFEIKDEDARLTVFMLDYQLDIQLTDGMEVKVVGSPSLFRKNSGFHIRAVKVQPVGAGALAKQLQLLKIKLEKEGLFATERKRALPRFPERVGLITSPDAAAYTDVLRVLNNRWGGLNISFYPTQVQGDGAVKSLLDALNHFQQQSNIDVIILTRGGGSLEDLVAFNAEAVARAIFATATPIVVGVGHERDWTIADLVADYRAATPSNAAESIVPERGEILGVIDIWQRTIHREVAGELEENKLRLTNNLQSLLRGPQRWQERFSSISQSFSLQFQHFRQGLRQQGQALQRTRQDIINGLRLSLTHSHERLAHVSKTIRSLAPQATLERGYSITFNEANKPVLAARAVKPGSKLRTKLASGSIRTTVNETHDQDNKKRR